MKFKVNWAHSAKKDYWENIDYLLENWSDEVASNFIDKTENIIDLIKQNPKTFPKSNYKSIRYIVIVPQITLYYKIKKKEQIELIRFWNNFKSPQDKNLT